MTALRKILIEEEPVFAAPVARAPATKLYVVTNTAPAEAAAAPETAGNVLKNIVLFFAAPFIGLAYIVALPFVGLAVLAVLAGRAVAKYEAVRTLGRGAEECRPGGCRARSSDWPMSSSSRSSDWPCWPGWVAGRLQPARAE